jgi:hydroxyethylthiazole kinase
VVTGKTDYVTSSSTTYAVHRGHEIMGRVVGTGCISTSTVGCFAAIGTQKLWQAAVGMGAFAVAGEIAAAKCKGPGDFIATLFNTVVELESHISPGELVFEEVPA